VTQNGAGLIIKGQQMSIEAVEFVQNTALGYGGGVVADTCFL
jgi:predicted outer membrane repeat protein